MNLFLTLSLFVVYAAFAVKVSAIGPPPIPGFAPIFPKGICKVNCTKAKIAYDKCCKDAGKYCQNNCRQQKYELDSCPTICKETNESCPNLKLSNETCKAICSFGPVSHLGQQLHQPIICTPLCWNDNECPEPLKCCPTACGQSCQKPE